MFSQGNTHTNIKSEESLGDMYFKKGEHELAIPYYSKEIKNYTNDLIAAYRKRSVS